MSAAERMAQSERPPSQTTILCCLRLHDGRYVLKKEGSQLVPFTAVCDSNVLYQNPSGENRAFPAFSLLEKEFSPTIQNIIGRPLVLSDINPSYRETVTGLSSVRTKSVVYDIPVPDILEVAIEKRLRSREEVGFTLVREEDIRTCSVSSPVTDQKMYLLFQNVCAYVSRTYQDKTLPPDFEFVSKPIEKLTYDELKRVEKIYDEMVAQKTGSFDEEIVSSCIFVDPSCQALLTHRPEAVKRKKRKPSFSRLLNLIEYTSLPHRINQEDIDLLERFTGPLDRFEDSLTVFRFVEYLASLGQGLAETLITMLVMSPQLTASGKESYLLALGSLVFLEGLGEVNDFQRKNWAGRKLGDITGSLMQDYAADARMAGIANLGGELNDIVGKLTDAEGVPPSLTESFPTIAGINVALAQKGLASTAATFDSCVALSQLVVAWLMRFQQSFLGEKLNTMASHIVASLARSATTIITVAAGENLDNKTALDIVIAGMGVSHLLEQLSDVEVIKLGFVGRNQLRSLLERLRLSIHTEDQWNKHARAIRSQEETGIVYGTKPNESRYVMLDQLQAEAMRTGKKLDPEFTYFFDFNVGRGNKILLERAQCIVPRGISYLETQGRSGATAILASLGDRMNHPSGSVLHRTTETDHNLHGTTERKVNYIDCGYVSEDQFKPNFAMAKDELHLYLRGTGMFAEEDIETYLKYGGKGDGVFRKKMLLAAAGSYAVTGQTKVLCIDNLSKDITDEATWDSIMTFLARLSNWYGTHILAGITRGFLEHTFNHRKTLLSTTKDAVDRSHSSLGFRYTVQSGKIVEIEEE